MRPIRDPLRYGFAVGRVRVLETRLLRRSHFERLLDAHTFESQLRVLSETVYGGYLEHARIAEDVERELDRALGDLYADFLESANLPHAIVAFFRSEHDFDNMRGRLKAEALGIPASDLLNDLGTVPAAAFLGEGESLPEELRVSEDRVRAALTDEDGGLDAELLDAAVDFELFAVRTRIAEGAESREVAQLAALTADVAAVKAFLRTRGAGLPVTEAERWFVPGGGIERSELVSLYRLPLEEAAAQLASRPPFKGVDPSALLDSSRFDVVADLVIARRLRKASMIAVGPEPVMAYVFARRAEVRAVRVLLIGRLAGVETDVLRERLREVA